MRARTSLCCILFLVFLLLLSTSYNHQSNHTIKNVAAENSIQLQTESCHSTDYNFFTNVSSVHINIGPNSSPREPENLNVTGLILVEPGWRSVIQLRKRYENNSNVLIIHSAVSANRGIMPFHTMGYGNDESSSLSLPRDDGARWGQIRTTDAIPVISFADVIRMVPEGIEVKHALLDMQGHELNAIKSAGLCLKRIRRIEYECDLYADKLQGYNVSGGNSQEAIRTMLEKMNFGRFWCMGGYMDQSQHSTNCRADNMDLFGKRN